MGVCQCFLHQEGRCNHKMWDMGPFCTTRIKKNLEKSKKIPKKSLTFTGECGIVTIPLRGSFFCANFLRRGQTATRLGIFAKNFAGKNGTRKREDLSARYLALPRVKFRKSGGAIMRVKITMACTECKQRNYDTIKNKKNNPDRLEMNKYCRFCRKHTLHRETK